MPASGDRADPRPSFEFAQQFCDDVVYAQGSFKPNAPGRWELSSLRAVSERQLLKSQASYFAERIVVAVTPVEVVAIAVDAISLLRRRTLVWARVDLHVQLVPCRAETRHPADPAFLLTRGGWSPRLEIAPRVDDDRSPDVITYLLDAGARRRDPV